MSLPDQSHIDRVRDARWSRPWNDASVEAEGGLSRCAVTAFETPVGSVMA